MHEQPLNLKEKKNGHPPRTTSFLGSKTLSRWLVILLGILLCLFIFVLTVTPKRYNLTPGLVPNITIAATKDVVDQLTTERKRESARAAVTPVFHYQDGVTEKVMTNLEEVYAQMLAVRQYAQSLPGSGPQQVYTDEEYEAAHNIMTLVTFKDFQLDTLMNATDQQFDEMYTSLSPAIRNTMQSNITQGQESTAINAIMQVVGYRTNVSLMQNVVLPVLRTIILPNMVVDEEATEAARKAAGEAVEPVEYKQGQNIVVAGEGLIQESQIKVLESLGLTSNSSIDYSMYTGALALTAGILALMTVLLWAFCKPLYNNPLRLSIPYLTIIITLVLGLLAKSIEIIYLTPLLLPFMLLAVTLGAVPALITGITTALVSVLMFTGGTTGTGLDMVNLLVLSLVAGPMSVALLNKKYQRSFILLAGGLASLVSFLVVLGIGLMTSMSLRITISKALWAMLGSAISTLLCVSLQPALESLFNLPTPMRLLDLTNPNHPLMRRLLMEAPGTYHHSIIIANLAEAAAEAIGANPLLARAGAYFHDIGKLKRPLYFKENQIGSANIHDNTDPQVSAAIIISHIREGLTLAKQHRLPAEIQQIIAEHHGDSLVAYFYHKAVKEAGDKPVDEADFRYPGVPPQTMEGAVIMICDTVEAAIRTLTNPTTDEIVTFIDELIQKKVQSGMMVNAPLTLKQLNIIRDSCAAVIYGVFHERIEYPKAADKLPPGERLLAHLQQLRTTSKPQVPSPLPLSPKPSKEVDEISAPPVVPPSTPPASKPLDPKVLTSPLAPTIKDEPNNQA